MLTRNENFNKSLVSTLPNVLKDKRVSLCIYGGIYFMKLICGIYKITSPKNRIYIGQSRDILGRWYSYKNLNLKYCKGQPRLHNSFKKYGIHKHKFEIIQEANLEDLDKLEIYYIALYQTFNTENGLNLQIGGDLGRVNSRLGIKHTEKTKLKMSISHKGHIVTKETREKLRAAKIGIPRNKETNLKVSKSLTGYKQTQEHKNNRINKLRGKKRTAEQKKGMSKARYIYLAKKNTQK